MILYHGSTTVIDTIDLRKSRPNKDFGQGFYLTTGRNQALRMAEFKALTEGGIPIINAFNFDETILHSNVVNFLQFEDYNRDWAEFIFLNRNNPTTLPQHNYDIVYGPIANDRVGVQISKYEAGDITLDQFLENLKYMKGITFQYYFGTEKAISYLLKV